MADLEIKKGCIFHWMEYEFDDGEKANKYFVILGAKAKHNYLAAIATSQSKNKNYNAGCHYKEGYYHIPGGRKDWFPRDTWILLSAPLEILPADFLKRALAKQITLSGELREDLANAIRNCLKQCLDVSAAHLKLL